MSDLLIAAHTAVMWHDGRRIKITKGKTVVRADDPIVEGREKLFRPLQARQFGQVESATAEPGEKRRLGGLLGPKPKPDAGSGTERPPTSGKGSGVEAWREYAAKVTDSPADSWAALSRDEIVALLDSEGADNAAEPTDPATQAASSDE